MIPVLPDRLYNLLPAVYRVADANQGNVLQALVAVLQQEFQALQDDIDQLYENWFIETCDEWVVPYIGDLLGVQGLIPTAGGAAFTQRAIVANTLATAPVEKMAKHPHASVIAIDFELNRKTRDISEDRHHRPRDISLGPSAHNSNGHFRLPTDATEAN